MRNNSMLGNITNINTYEGELICWQNVLEDLDIIIINKFKCQCYNVRLRIQLFLELMAGPLLDGVDEMSIVSLPPTWDVQEGIHESTHPSLLT